MKISIIIPILNEANTIIRLLEYLSLNSSSGNIEEVLVVDGGSSDGSQNLISDFTSLNEFSISSKVELINSEKGRAQQMNLGAKHASGDILYFLHADSIPPKNFDQAILKSIDAETNAGCFRMKFDQSHPVLKFSQWFTRFNLRICRGGDQSLFITKRLFDTLDGYNEDFIIYEDNEFIGRIYKATTFKVAPEYLTTSSRRYAQNGSWKLQYHFTRIHLKKLFGASPDELYQYYRRNIAS